MEKIFHSILLKVFVKPEEDLSKIKETFVSLIPFEDFTKEKIKLQEEKATIVNDRSLTILSVNLEKQRHINKFVDFFKTSLSEDIKKTLIEQLDSRLDSELNFFVRFDKNSLIDNKFVLTDSGDCFHFKFLVASYPAKKEIAREILVEFLA